jgi:DNA-binding CsgD family transcriptional regulator
LLAKEERYMARLSARDESSASEVIRFISEREPGGAGLFEGLLPMSAELLGAPLTSAYRLRRAEPAGAKVDYLKFSRLPCEDDEIRPIFSPFLKRMEMRRGLYDPIRPQRSQRNRALILPWTRWCRGNSATEVARELRSDADHLGLCEDEISHAAETTWELETCLRRLNIVAYTQMRVLLCEGQALLAWFGAFQPEPFSARQQLLLRRIASPLRERLIVERRAGGGVGHAAMAAALEHVPAAAYLLDARGTVLHANAVGRHRLDTQGSAMRLALRRALKQAPGARGELALTQLVGPGLPPLFLAVSGTHGDRVRFGIQRARKRWQLTCREVEVLAQLVAGRTNQDIADQLGCAPRTVEIHVSSLLRKAHADSRSQLIVDLWHLADAS